MRYIKIILGDTYTDWHTSFKAKVMSYNTVNTVLYSNIRVAWHMYDIIYLLLPCIIYLALFSHLIHVIIMTVSSNLVDAH